MNNFYTYLTNRTACLLCFLLSAAGTFPALAQATRPVKSPNFLRLYPFDILSPACELRLGVELGVGEKQAVVIDGSRFFGDKKLLGAGWAVKTDYRFYAHQPTSKFRFFYGPNFMFKLVEFVDGLWYDADGNMSRRGVQDKTVCTVNAKFGMDMRLGRKARLEFFGGYGLRYQSVAEGLDLDRSNNANVYTPNILLGGAVKF